MVSAFSIGTSKRSNEQPNEKEKYPGPGTYSPEKNKNKAPQWIISKSKRELFQIKENPAPTDYNPSKPNAKSPKFQFGLKLNDSDPGFPGPSDYNAKAILPKEPSFSFGLKTINDSMIPPEKLINKRSLSPGPGTYDVSQQNNSSFIFKFSDYEKYLFKEKKKMPGPGEYENVKVFKMEAPKFSFGKSIRKNDLEDFKVKNEKTPGPAEYNAFLQDNLKNTPILRGRLPDLIQKSKEKLPGVGEYNLEIKNKKIPIKFTRENRSHSPQITRYEQTPGPGSYLPLLLQKSDSPLYKIGTAPKEIPIKNSPGPGDYDLIPKKTEGPQYSIDSNLKRQLFQEHNKNSRSPGPGCFSPKYIIIKDRSPSPLIGTSKREEPDSRRKYPGVGEYNLRKEKPDGPAFIMGTEKREVKKNEKSNWPGPGQYQIKPAFADVPYYLMPSKQKITLN